MGSVVLHWDSVINRDFWNHTL